MQIRSKVLELGRNIMGNGVINPSTLLFYDGSRFWISPIRCREDLEVCVQSGLPSHLPQADAPLINGIKEVIFPIIKALPFGGADPQKNLTPMPDHCQVVQAPSAEESSSSESGRHLRAVEPLGLREITTQSDIFASGHPNRVADAIGVHVVEI